MTRPRLDYMNNIPKFVVSKTLEEPLEWNNSTLIKGDVAEEITELKGQPGKDITIIGSPTLVRSLLEDGPPRRAEAHGPPDRGGDRKAPV